MSRLSEKVLQDLKALMFSESEEWEMESRDSFCCSSTLEVVRRSNSDRPREGQRGEHPFDYDSRLEENPRDQDVGPCRNLSELVLLGTW